MFFRRNEGQYRETDRVTRFKLVKSGKHWLRAATSHFGLFKIISGRVDASSVSVHQVEEEVRTPECTHSGLASFHFARRYFGNR